MTYLILCEQHAPIKTVVLSHNITSLKSYNIARSRRRAVPVGGGCRAAPVGAACRPAPSSLRESAARRCTRGGGVERYEWSAREPVTIWVGAVPSIYWYHENPHLEKIFPPRFDLVSPTHKPNNRPETT